MDDLGDRYVKKALFACKLRNFNGMLVCGYFSVLLDNMIFLNHRVKNVTVCIRQSD